MKIDNDFYKRSIRFCNTKQNTKIVIKVRNNQVEKDQVNFIHYKKLFYETKHQLKFNMQLIYYMINVFV